MIFMPGGNSDLMFLDIYFLSHCNILQIFDKVFSTYVDGLGIKINHEGVKYYNDIIDALLERGKMLSLPIVNIKNIILYIKANNT